MRLLDLKWIYKGRVTICVVVSLSLQAATVTPFFVFAMARRLGMEGYIRWLCFNGDL